MNAVNNFEQASQKYHQLKLKSMMGDALSEKESAFVSYFGTQVLGSNLISNESNRTQAVSLFFALFKD